MTLTLIATWIAVGAVGLWWMLKDDDLAKAELREHPIVDRAVTLIAAVVMTPIALIVGLVDWLRDRGRS